MLDDVRAAAPDLYFAVLLAPAKARQALTALFALESELLKIPSRVTQPTLGLVRVTWWRDRLAARDAAQPLLKELATAWPDDAAVLADFADSFSVLFDDLPADAAQKIIKARALLWATLVARVLQCPVPEAYAAAAAHYELEDGSATKSTPPNTPKYLKIIMRIGARRAAKRNNWLGHVWTALYTAL